MGGFIIGSACIGVGLTGVKKCSVNFIVEYLNTGMAGEI